MRVLFADAKLERICTQEAQMKRKLGGPVAKGLRRRMAELYSANSVKDLWDGPGKWHRLSADRGGEISGSLSANWRIVLSPADDDVSEVAVDSIEDYH
ncbi:plasmid maintenance system killer protein [Aeromicrobium phragmitis]|uniref:Plasmid maintenance system killer protein n=1 Tax=Aeromicrobium phragmitis TaxID=2478914 RepID=A0A3L8PLA5_9ACTN|nr:type II toxin-antitoxin system RelE/ParE family toxin [Aeromicrobium phragmitis]RLV56030.1 plasmid maintenance system killer protein [Aeromicrobium phragmitis]